MPAASPVAEEALAHRVRPLVHEDQAQHLQRGAPLFVLGNAVAAVMTAITLRDTTARPVLLAWLAAMLLASAVRAWSIWRTPARGTAPAQALRAATRSAALTGLLWGVGVLLIFPGAGYGHRALLMVLLSGLATGAMFALAVHLRALVALYLPVVAGVVAAALSNGGPARWPVAMLTLLWLVLALISARQLQATVLGSYRSRHTAALLAVDLQAQKDVAVALGQSRSRFLAAASHDLRQPVHALSLFVSALQQRPAAAEAERLLGHVRNTVDGLGRMFNALLDISRLDAEVVRPALQAVDLPPLLARLAADEGAIASAKGLQLRLEPAQAAPMLVHTDAQLLERVLRNLVSNAVRYTETGGVMLRTDVRHGRVRLRVADSGRGIPRDRRQDVFQEFVQLHNPQRNSDQGLGLGLSLVQRLCALLAVPLRLTSRPGRGTVFTLLLPVAQPLASPASPAGPHREAAGSATPAATGLAPGDVVLVVDDAADIRAATGALLRSWGCQAFLAEDLPTLMPQLMTLTVPPRLILCDLRLQGPDDGLAVIEQLRGSFNDEVPALLITGDTGPERLRDIMASGVSLLHKPVHEAALREAISQALAAHGAGD